MAYHRDFTKITIDDLTTILEDAPLVPSRRLIQDGLHDKMTLLKESGMTTLAQLQKTLKSKKGFAELCQRVAIEEEYLKILLREVTSWQPKPNKLADFPGTDQGLIDTLAGAGIKQSKVLYERIVSLQDRIELAETLGLDANELERLARLCDLSRVRWVNHTFAFMLYESGYRTLKALATAEVDTLYEDANRINREHNFYRNAIGIRDIALVIRAANDINDEMEYGTLPGK